MQSDNWGIWFLDLLPGLWISLQLTAMFLLIGLPIATLFALGLEHRNRYVRLALTVLVEIGRGVPALVMLYIVYFGFPQLGMAFPAMLSAGVALGLSFAAYASEVIRSGITAVPTGQTEAAQALGLSGVDRFIRVIAPQATRIIIPPLLGWAIVFFQATSLAFAIAVPELLSRAYTLATQNFQYFTLIAMAAVIYAAISIPLSLFSEYLATRRSQRAGS